MSVTLLEDETSGSSADETSADRQTQKEQQDRLMLNELNIKKNIQWIMR